MANEGFGWNPPKPKHVRNIVLVVTIASWQTGVFFATPKTYPLTNESDMRLLQKMVDVS